MLNNLKSLALAVILSLIIIIFCNISDQSFFFVDDAQNEFLPFMREIGKIWLSGEVPFILKDTFIGSNTLIDIHRAIFLPQNILLSILSTKIDSMFYISNISALINMTLISFSAMKLSDILRLKKYYGYIMGILFNISPVFLYFYIPSWWNGAIGHAWFIASLTSLLLIRNHFSAHTSIVNVICVISLMLSGWPHSVVAYAAACFILCIEKLYKREFAFLAKFILLNISVIMMIIPNYSEYMYSSSLIERNTVFGNFQNFLSINFNQLIMSFNPVYHSFMNTFGGYRLTKIPFGYSSIYILFLFCFVDYKKFFNNNDKIFLGFIILGLFLLSQTPSAFGPLRWPLRFVPFLSIAIIIFCIMVINEGMTITRNRIKVFFTALFISCILSIFSQEGDFTKVLIIQILFLIITTCYLFFVKNKPALNSASGIMYSYGCLIMMLFAQPSVIGYMSTPSIHDTINMENNYSNGGYILSLTNGREPKDHIEDLHSAQYLAYGVKSINGASPVGNKELAKLLITRQSQAFFEIEQTVINLSHKYGEHCFYDYLNIDVVVINRNDLNDTIRNKLETCGFKHKEVRNQFVDYFTRDDNSGDSGLSFSNSSSKLDKVIANKYNEEEYIIVPRENVKAIFSRTYWYGYKAYINDKEVPVSNFNGLVSVDIDKKFDNTPIKLKLSYFPASWAISLWISLFGFFFLIITLWLTNKKAKNNV